MLATLAAAKRPLTPREVLAQLERELAYTTVMTTRARLHAKDAVTRQRVGRAYAYAYADGATVAARRSGGHCCCTSQPISRITTTPPPDR